jgi:ParB family chromosome partitioning protein
MSKNSTEFGILKEFLIESAVSPSASLCRLTTTYTRKGLLQLEFFLMETIQKGRLAHVPLKLIAMGRNPREFFDDAEQADLDRSVAQQGVMTPILIREIGPNQYELVAGERRYRAAVKAFGIDAEIPASIFEMDDADALLTATVENVIRANMSPAEESRAAAKLLAYCRGDRDEVALRMGMSRSTIDKRLALMNASDLVLTALTHRKITLGHAELLAAAAKATQDNVLTKIMAMPTLLSVTDLKGNLARVARSLAIACFDKTECAACPHNSDTQQAMFSEAIDAGNCTNGDCYTEKTEAVLATKKATLAETFPRIEIVRQGDNYSVIKLTVEGSKGVGNEQAKACRTCANFGAAISAIPGKEGNVYEDQCFDAGCNTRMVAKQLKSVAAAAAAANPVPATAAAKSDVKAPAKASSPAKPSDVTACVLTYRKKVWRDALRADLQPNPRRSIEFMIALAMAGAAREVQSAKIDKAQVQGLNGKSILADLKALMAADGKCISHTVASLSITTLDQLNDEQVKQALLAFEVDLSKTFAVNAEYLKLLTKVEIDAVAKEIGLAKAYGDGFAKILSGKKEDAVMALMAVAGFNYHVVPAQLTYL